MSAAVAHAPDIRPIRSLVRTTRLLLRSGTGLVGLGLTAGVAATALLVAVAADLLFPLVGPWVRVAGLLLVVTPTVVVFVWKGLCPFAHRLRDAEIARRIEGRLPGMHSRLVSCLDLAGRTDEVSPAFFRKLVAESLDRLGAYRPASVVDWRGVRTSLAFAVMSLAMLAGAWLALEDRFTTALVRVFQPNADVPPIGNVTFAVEPGTTRVLSGEDITFAAVITRGEPSGLTVELVGEDAVVRHPLELAAEGAWLRTLRGLSAEKAFAKGLTYRIFGGGTWSREHRIDWAERPAVADVRVRVHHPAYMGILEPRPAEARRNRADREHRRSRGHDGRRSCGGRTPAFRDAVEANARAAPIGAEPHVAAGDHPAGSYRRTRIRVGRDASAPSRGGPDMGRHVPIHRDRHVSDRLAERRRSREPADECGPAVIPRARTARRPSSSIVRGPTSF